MPEPDSHLRRPRPISAFLWLLMLLPSPLSIIVPLNLSITIRLVADFAFLLGLILLFVLSYSLGLLVEKWRWGSVKNFDRALRYGALIVTVNGFILILYMLFSTVIKA